jgi:hypothetical protein
MQFETWITLLRLWISDLFCVTFKGLYLFVRGIIKPACEEYQILDTI